MTCKHPRLTGNVFCDTCGREHLLQAPFFYRCQYAGCNADCCAYCYFLYLTDRDEAVEKLKLKKNMRAAGEAPNLGGLLLAAMLMGGNRGNRGGI